ncbi:protein NEDD1-like [Diorhabda carinulata]|uniref:protein NEDD1-like n=1 Tax=Diorhabda carinulata TaxID=1163345 RepID=UPI0025A293F4|nr:protein NEDD1-like [Diorhabda carinulata]XP_057666810.1 protein NEDD1-like [Diorhabda carinulata]XP_057666811.1 protein NEDD1-like [Diorhabda carinulata]
MYIASVSTTIKFHEFPNGNVIHNYQPGKVEGPVRSLSWSRDGNWLVVVPHSGQTEIVGTKDQLKLLKTIHEVDEPTAACFQNTTKKNIGIGTKSGLVLIYDIKSRNVKKRFPRASTQITHVAFTAKDSHCITGCKNGEVLVYNNVTNSPPSNLRVPKSNSITCLKTNQLKRNLVLGGSNEGIIVVWDININRSKFCTEAHKAPVNAIAISPVNVDLIVTAGADRQFCFYDIADHKCIANISVENCITAVDFSPDGTHFVMGSQNGRVYIYDSRNIQQPVNSFLAHTSAVRHIAFQNRHESSDSSVCSLSKSFDNVAITQEEKRRNKSVRTSDFFGMHLYTVDAGLDRKSVASVGGEDSFIVALGLDKDNTTESINNDVFVEDISSKPNNNDLDLPCSISLQLNKPEAGDLKMKQFSSTPIFNIHHSLSELSQTSNVMHKSTTNATNSDEIKTLVKECFSEEFKTVIDDLKNDIKYESTHTTHQMRIMFLEMHMAMVKMALKLEDFSKRIRYDPHPTSNYENSLVDEIERLRKRNDFLEEQLKNSTVAKSVNGE